MTGLHARSRCRCCRRSPADSPCSTTGSPRSRRRRSRTARSSTPPPRRASSSTARTRTSPRSTTRETIFERLEAHGQTWKVYVDPPAIAPFTGLIHGARLQAPLRDPLRHHRSVLRGCRERRSADLLVHRTEPDPRPQRHAPADRRADAGSRPRPAVRAARRRGVPGQALRRDPIADSRRRAPIGGTPCSWWCFDEHGGTYDHVPPPAASPPDATAPAGQYGFAFDRLGIRLPAIAISPWIDERTVINDVHHHTSVIRTLRERWDLGEPLTQRDADAPDLAPLLTRDMPARPRSGRTSTHSPCQTSTSRSSRSTSRCRRSRRRSSAAEPPSLTT